MPRCPSAFATAGRRTLLVAAVLAALAIALAQPSVLAELGEVGFSQPHSAVHAVADDVYLVSNVGGTGAGEGEHGFISRLSPAGEVLELRWIDGAMPGVELDAPRGMGIFAGRLWVADADHVRVYDVRTGEPLFEVPIVGAQQLTGLVVGLDGSVFVTDVGRGVGTRFARGMAIYRIDRELRVVEVLAGPGAPSTPGVAVLGPDTIAATTTDGAVLSVHPDGTIASRRTIADAALGGAVVHASGDLLVASPSTSSVVRVSGEGAETWIGGVGAPADVGYDATRNRLIVPSLTDHRVRIVQAP